MGDLWFARIIAEMPSQTLLFLHISPSSQHGLHHLCEELYGYGQTSPSLRELPGTSYAFGDPFFSRMDGWGFRVVRQSDFELLRDVSHQNCTCAKLSAVSAADSCVRVECGMILVYKLVTAVPCDS